MSRDCNRKWSEGALHRKCGGTLGSRPLFPACPPSPCLWELGLLCDAAMSLSIDEPAASRLFVVAGRSTSVSWAACAAA